MHVGIDACCWSNRRGFGRYTRELIARLVTEHPSCRFTLVVDRWTAAAAGFPTGASVEVVDTRTQPTRAASAAGSRSLGDLWKMARAVARLDLDAFWFPAVYTYFALLSRVPTAVTFHDAIAERHPHLIFPDRRGRWMWRLKTRLAMRQATRILSVSDDARRAVAESFGRSIDSIAVTGEGAASCFRPATDRAASRAALVEHGFAPNVPLLLYVGGLSPHKNIGGLLRGLAALRERSNMPWQVGLVGDLDGDAFHGCAAELRDLAARLELTDRVRFTGFVPDERLVHLYQAAAVLVLPSVEEGFGLPAAEAMACGTPVACSRTGALPEVVGDAGLLFDPHDSGSIAAALERILADDEFRKGLAEAGLRRAATFSWSRAAQVVIEVLEEMTHGRAHRRASAASVLHGHDLLPAVSFRR